MEKFNKLKVKTEQKIESTFTDLNWNYELMDGTRKVLEENKKYLMESSEKIDILGRMLTDKIEEVKKETEVK